MRRRNVLATIGSGIGSTIGYQKMSAFRETGGDSIREREEAGGGKEINITTASELRTAMNNAEPGNELVVEDGVYQFSSGLRPSAGGEDGNRILMRPAEGASPVIEFTGTEFGDDDSGIQIRGPYWTVRGFEVRGSTWKGMNVDGAGHDITFENLNVHDCNLWGIMNNGGDNVVFRNCVSHDNYDPQNEGQNSDGFNMTGPTSGNLIEYCSAWNNGDDGFDMWVTEDETIRYCWAWNNGRGEAGNGNGFKLGSQITYKGYGGGGHLVHDCVAYNNRQSGFWWNGEEDNPIEVYNCTAWNNSIEERTHPDAANFAFKDGEHVLKNNLSANGRVVTTDIVTEEANSWNLGISDVEFKSINPHTECFLQPAANSEAIDAGVDIGHKYTGKAPDLGAFETAGSGKSSTCHDVDWPN